MSPRRLVACATTAALAGYTIACATASGGSKSAKTESGAQSKGSAAAHETVHVDAGDRARLITAALDAGTGHDDENDAGECDDEQDDCLGTPLIMLRGQGSRSAQGSSTGLAVGLVFRGKDRPNIETGYELTLAECQDHGACGGGSGKELDLGLGLMWSYGSASDFRSALYFAPAMHLVLSDAPIDPYLAMQVGGEFRFKGTPASPANIGLRLYAEPVFPLNGGSIDVMFGLAVQFGVELGRERRHVRTKPDTASAALIKLVNRELSDIALGDAAPDQCLIEVSDTPRVPSGSVKNPCIDELTRDIKAQTCTTFVSVPAEGKVMNARLMRAASSDSIGETLVEDLTVSDWPVLTYCNTQLMASEAIRFEAWAPAEPGTTSALVSRFDSPIPWPIAGGTHQQTTLTTHTRVQDLRPGPCKLVQFVHARDRVEFTVSDGAVQLSFYAPWYVEFKQTQGENLDVLDNAQWTKPVVVLTKTFELTTTEVGGPAIVCAARTASGAAGSTAEVGGAPGSAADAGNTDAAIGARGDASGGSPESAGQADSAAAQPGLPAN